MPTFPRGPSQRLRLAAYALLVLGWLAAIGVYLAAVHGAADSAAQGEDSLERSAQELLQLERIGGKSMVRILDFERWVGSLWHGQRLAATLAVLTTIVVLLCLYIADLIGEDDHKPISQDSD